MIDDFKEVLSKTRIDDVIAKRLGRNSTKVGTWLDFGECPFCGGHDCFRARLDQGNFYCFQCAIGGNAVNFIRHYQKLSSNFEALKVLAQEVGQPLSNSKDYQQKSEAEQVREQIFAIAAAWYHGNLMKNEKALKWFQEKRFHTKEIIEKFQIGWSGDQPDGLYKHLLESKINETNILTSGLVKQTEKQEVRDFFSTHLYIYPWRFHSVIGHFSFKCPTKKLAYQLPNQFRSSELLFYNQSDLFRDLVIIVEGENDLLTVQRALWNDPSYKSWGVIACHGQISQKQLDYFRSIGKGKEFYLAFDNDDAGGKYTQKVIDYLSDIAEVNILKFDMQFKDIDEYLRDKPAPEVQLSQIIKESTDGIRWQIDKLEDCADSLKVRKIIAPTLEKIIRIKDDRLDAYIDLLVTKYDCLKRSNLVKQLKSLGAQFTPNEVHSFEIYDSNAQIYVSENCYWVPTKDDKRMMYSKKLQRRFIFSHRFRSGRAS
jgi:DNA primase catalytic core